MSRMLLLALSQQRLRLVLYCNCHLIVTTINDDYDYGVKFLKIIYDNYPFEVGFVAKLGVNGLAEAFINVLGTNGLAATDILIAGGVGCGVCCGVGCGVGWMTGCWVKVCCC